MKKSILVPAALCSLLLSLQPAFSQGTAFTYQGLLTLAADGSPVTGLYDFSFNLFAVDSGGSPQAVGVTNAGVGVTDGLFKTTIDFLKVFTGTRYWLEIGSRTNGSTAAFETMSPRQELTPVPYAIFAENIAPDAIVTASLHNGAVTSAKIAAPLELDASNPGGSVLFGKNTAGPGSDGTGVLGSGDTGVVGNGVSAGVRGYSTSGFGVYGSSSGEGVYGIGRNGVHGVSSSDSDSGVWGQNTANGFGVFGNSSGGNGVNGTSSTADGVYGSGKNGVHGHSSSSSDSGVWGDNSGGGYGVFGQSTSGDGTFGSSGAGTGVQGASASGWGVYGHSLSNIGVYGQSQTGDGVSGITYGDGVSGVVGRSTRAAAWGGYFVNSAGGEALHAEGNASINGTMTVKVLTINGADVAEPFEVSTKNVLKGSVMVIDADNPGQLRLSNRAYDKRVAGILSGANGVRAGICLSQQGFNDGGQNVALSGRVYVLADASSGPIRPGDLLTTSNTPGHAMKVTDYAKAQGAVIGKAMSALNEGKGMVLVLVSLQ